MRKYNIETDFMIYRSQGLNFIPDLFNKKFARLAQHGKINSHTRQIPLDNHVILALVK